MGSAARVGVWTCGEGGFGIAGGFGASARADALVSKAKARAMAKVRMLASSLGHSPQSSLFQSTHAPGLDLHGRITDLRCWAAWAG